MPNEQHLQERWRELVGTVRREMVTQDRNVLKEDFANLKISLPLSNGVDWCAREFAQDEVLNGDLAQLARDFYKHYQAGCD